MSKFWIAILVALGLALSACTSTPPPTEEQQVANLVAELKAAGFNDVDTKIIDGKAQRYEHAEDEEKEKIRKYKKGSKTRTLKVTKNTRVAEVVVVVSGNCKMEFEKQLNSGYPYYLDETRNVNGTERDIDEKYEPVVKREHAERYLRDHAGDFSYCMGQAFTPTTVDA